MKLLYPIKPSFMRGAYVGALLFEVIIVEKAGCLCAKPFMMTGIIEARVPAL